MTTLLEQLEAKSIEARKPILDALKEDIETTKRSLLSAAEQGDNFYILSLYGEEYTDTSIIVLRDYFKNEGIECGLSQTVGGVYTFVFTWLKYGKKTVLP